MLTKMRGFPPWVYVNGKQPEVPPYYLGPSVHLSADIHFSRRIVLVAAEKRRNNTLSLVSA